MTSSQLATRNGSSDISWTDEQKKLIATVIAPGCTGDELRLFAYHCQRTGLDPFSKQIYAIKRGGRMTIQVSIDGLRAIAERTGQLDGSQKYWCGPEGDWQDVWLADKPPTAAKAVIYRKGCSHPFVGVALFRDYNAGQGLWTKMPSVMLGKCAEAQALRAGFPADLSGLYASEEMDQADVKPPDVVHVAAPVPAVQSSQPPAAPISAPAIDLEVVESHPSEPASESSPKPINAAEPQASTTPVTASERLEALTGGLTATGKKTFLALYKSSQVYADCSSIQEVLQKIKPEQADHHLASMTDDVIASLNDGKHPKTGEQLVNKPGRKPAVSPAESVAPDEDNPFTE